MAQSLAFCVCSGACDATRPQSVAPEPARSRSFCVTASPVWGLVACAATVDGAAAEAGDAGAAEDAGAGEDLLHAASSKVARARTIQELRMGILYLAGQATANG